MGQSKVNERLTKVYITWRCFREATGSYQAPVIQLICYQNKHDSDNSFIQHGPCTAPWQASYLRFRSFGGMLGWSGSNSCWRTVWALQLCVDVYLRCLWHVKVTILIHTRARHWAFPSNKVSCLVVLRRSQLLSTRVKVLLGSALANNTFSLLAAVVVVVAVGDSTGVVEFLNKGNASDGGEASGGSAEVLFSSCWIRICSIKAGNRSTVTVMSSL